MDWHWAAGLWALDWPFGTLNPNPALICMIGALDWTSALVLIRAAPDRPFSLICSSGLG